MARDHKQRQTRASHGQAPQRDPELCRICGTFTYHIEWDHPFRRENDIDFKIALCRPCHREVTIWDATIDQHVSMHDHVAAPFVYILHRIQLTFMKRGMDSQTVDLRDLEASILGTVNHRCITNYGHKRRHRSTISDNDMLVLLTDIAVWAQRAAELTNERLRTDEKARFRSDYELLTSVVSDISTDPRQFYELLMTHLSSPDGKTLSDRANSLIDLISERGNLTKFYALWQESADALNQLPVGVTK